MSVIKYVHVYFSDRNVLIFEYFYFSGDLNFKSFIPLHKEYVHVVLIRHILFSYPPPPLKRNIENGLELVQKCQTVKLCQFYKTA